VTARTEAISARVARTVERSVKVQSGQKLTTLQVERTAFRTEGAGVGRPYGETTIFVDL
jgi:hypothetical protein